MPRFTTGKYDAERLRATAQRIERQVQRTIQLADSVEAQKIDALVIRHQRDLTDGLDAIEKWADAGERAFRNKINGLPDDDTTENGDGDKPPKKPRR